MMKCFDDGYGIIEAYPIAREEYIRSKTLRYSFTQEDTCDEVWDIVEDVTTGDYYYLHI